MTTTTTEKPASRAFRSDQQACEGNKTLDKCLCYMIDEEPGIFSALISQNLMNDGHSHRANHQGNLRSHSVMTLRTPVSQLERKERDGRTKAKVEEREEGVRRGKDEEEVVEEFSVCIQLLRTWKQP